MTFLTVSTQFSTFGCKRLLVETIYPILVLQRRLAKLQTLSEFVCVSPLNFFLLCDGEDWQINIFKAFTYDMFERPQWEGTSEGGLVTLQEATICCAEVIEQTRLWVFRSSYLCVLR